MALLSLQQIHKARSMKITSFVVWISTLNREILSLLLGEMVLVNQP